MQTELTLTSDATPTDYQQLAATLTERGISNEYDEELGKLFVGNLEYGLAAQVAEERGLEVQENGDA